MHPIQTESVAYVASRSETLSVLFYYAAFCVFLYRRTESISWLRALAVMALFGAAVATKQHTLTLPLLLLLTDLFWAHGSAQGRMRKHSRNRLLYAFLAVAGACGAWFVWTSLRIRQHRRLPRCRLDSLDLLLHRMPRGVDLCAHVCAALRTECRSRCGGLAQPAGFRGDRRAGSVGGCRGSGVDLSQTLAAGLFRRVRVPAADRADVLVVPISEPLQERRLYLPFLGLALVCLEFLRRLDWKQRLVIEVPVLIVMAALTYQRSAVWGSEMALWKDTVAKSPKKVRPRLQLADAYYQRSQFAEAAENYEKAARLAPPDYLLLVNYGLALDRGGHYEEALAKLKQAAALEYDPQVWALIGQVYGEQHKTDEAFEVLRRAEAIDPGFELTYEIRGNVYEFDLGNKVSAAEQYRRALQIDPYNDAVRQALERVERR